MTDSGQTIWVLADDRAGNRSQALGVATVLNDPFEVRELSYSPFAAIPNALMAPTFLGLTAPSRRQFSPPWPGLIIAAGRRTAPVARKIKRASGGRSRLVQIMHPGGSTDDMDLVCVPSHDPPQSGNNVLPIVGAPHGLTPESLAAARDSRISKIGHLPPPYIALIVGGTTRRRQFTDKMARELAKMASAMALQAGGSLLVTTSRRTGAATQSLIENIRAPAEIYRWTDPGENPYSGFLACADATIVTGDSISMCSEACAGTDPVYVFAPDALTTDKHRRFHEVLFAGGYARPLTDELANWVHDPLNAATEIAAKVRLLVS